MKPCWVVNTSLAGCRVVARAAMAVYGMPLPPIHQSPDDGGPVDEGSLLPNDLRSCVSDAVMVALGGKWCLTGIPPRLPVRLRDKDPIIIHSGVPGVDNEVPVRADWTMERRGELHEKLLGQVCGKLEENGIVTYALLKELVELGELGKIIKSVGVLRALEDRIELEANNQRKAEFKKQRFVPTCILKLNRFIAALAGTLEAMEQTCLNYGIVSALLLSMTFSNFATITPDEMAHYSSAIAMEKYCKSEHSCGDDVDFNVCREAMSIYQEAKWTDLSQEESGGVTLDCCASAIKCAEDHSEVAEFFHVLFNGASSCLLLTVGMLSAYLYIALFATSANRERKEEQDILIEKLTGEFIMMQLLFVSGVVTACLGIWCVLIIKPVSTYVADVGTVIFFFGIALLFFAVTKVLISILQVNRQVKKNRSKPRNATATVKGLKTPKTGVQVHAITS